MTRWGLQPLHCTALARFGRDLEKVFLSVKKPFPLPTVLNLAVQLLDTLEFIHSHNYCHNDIKAANILLDSSGRDVFLVDLGLACKYKNYQGFYCNGEPDARRAHEGTLEYASRDTHTGAHSRRGDLKSLGYCLLHWAGGRLPWLHLADSELVEATKDRCLTNLPAFLSSCFRPSLAPAGLAAYWEAVAGLAFTTRPDYEAVRAGLVAALEGLGGRSHDRLMFAGPTQVPS
jgi:vaccinia related kinase